MLNIRPMLASAYVHVVEDWQEPGMFAGFWVNTESLVQYAPDPWRAAYLAVRAMRVAMGQESAA